MFSTDVNMVEVGAFFFLIQVWYFHFQVNLHSSAVDLIKFFFIFEEYQFPSSVHAMASGSSH
jgi:hypothetical protein